MKAAQEKIHVQDLLSIYSVDHIANYQHCPQVLAEQIKDLETISAMAHSQFSEYVVDFRKKSLEYDKTFKVCDRISKEILEETRLRRRVTNPNFAFSIHSLSAQSILSQFPQRRLLTELKLKFLESEGVDQHSWERWFRPEEKILEIKDQKNKFEIKLGIRLTEDNPPALQWDIFDATSNFHRHPQLFFFLKEYTYWIKLNDPEWQCKFISKLQLILNNLPSIFLFLAMRDEIIKRDGEGDQQTLKLSPVKNGSLKYTWKFEVFQQLECPKVTFFVNQQKYFQLQFQGGTYKGELYMNVFDKLVVMKHLEPISLQNRAFLYDFSTKLHNYSSIFKTFAEKYSNLNQSAVLFLVLQGKIWKPDGLALKEEDHFNISEGIWAQLAVQNGIILKIDEDMNLSYPQFQRGFFSLFLPKLQMSDLLIHIHLRNQLLRHNKEYEFKIFRISFNQTNPQFKYEFRSFKNNENIRIFKPPRMQQTGKLSHSNDSFVLILKVAADFKDVSFSAYKSSQGQNNQQKIYDSFLPLKWKEYRSKAKANERLDWRRICQCMIYLCKYYLLERSYNKRMPEEQKKWIKYYFK